ncbi:4Fe-4S binding protein [Rhizobiales bacterium]|uniref:NosR/NirI family protein n=1 Tax=Hongsoonwoonella zoysiae TaxID=2821844 RepID=UPI001560D16F|nr:NosR/NirI family protein [Hongsoonwoonella zoysiae]NRG18219.1 4Fe-4S binding protein [Hongsoonwoonella zoysiae]
MVAIVHRLKAALWAVVLLAGMAMPVVAAGEKTLREAAAGILNAGPAGLDLSQLETAPDVYRIEGEAGGGSSSLYVGSSFRLVGSLGYSGKPVDVAVVVDVSNAAARISGAKLLSHSEPILTLGIDTRDLARYVGGFAGTDVDAGLAALVRGGSLPDAVSGATVSSGAIRNAILRAGRTIARAARAETARTGAAIREMEDFPDFVEGGAISRMSVDFAAARAALPGYTTIDPGKDTFVELHAGVLRDQDISARLLGPETFARVDAERGRGETALFIAASGLYSVKGTGWKKSGVFDRLELVQGDKTNRISSDRHIRLEELVVKDAPNFREAMVAFLPAASGFDPEKAARLDLVVTAPDGSSARFGLDLAPEKVPDEAANQEMAGEPEGWRLEWEARAPDLAILTVMLTVLFAVLYVSGPLVRHAETYRTFRTGFLLVTLIWLGWIAGAQLSVVQVVSFIHALLADFRWQTFLLDPLVFTLWAFVAITLVFWGRGVYCGWLCPFGALQELTNQAARHFKFRQIEIPWEIHIRLWPIKYIFLFLIIGVSLQEIGLAFRLAEVEPFKTAITLHFLRPPAFVAYALILLFAGLFVERAFCRYLCPLGAALALPSKFKIFDWLVRRPQCGRECRLCATTCTVQAIDPIGRINPNECIYCLRCQANYHDETVCVPLKMRARRRNAASPPEPDKAS